MCYCLLFWFFFVLFWLVVWVFFSLNSCLESCQILTWENCPLSLAVFKVFLQNLVQIFWGKAVFTLLVSHMLIWGKNFAGKFLNGAAVIKAGHFSRLKKCHVLQVALLRCGTISQWSVIHSFPLFGPVSGDFGLCLRLLGTCKWN